MKSAREFLGNLDIDAVEKTALIQIPSFGLCLIQSVSQHYLFSNSGHAKIDVFYHIYYIYVSSGSLFYMI